MLQRHACIEAEALGCSHRVFKQPQQPCWNHLASLVEQAVAGFSNVSTAAPGECDRWRPTPAPGAHLHPTAVPVHQGLELILRVIPQRCPACAYTLSRQQQRRALTPGRTPLRAPGPAQQHLTERRHNALTRDAQHEGHCALAAQPRGPDERDARAGRGTKTASAQSPLVPCGDPARHPRSLMCYLPRHRGRVQAARRARGALEPTYWPAC